MEILGAILNMSIVGSIMFILFLLIKPITKKYFNSSWHYKILILILIFFIVPVGGFIKFPTKLIPNIPPIEIQETSNIDNIVGNKKTKGIHKIEHTKKQQYEGEIKEANPTAKATANYNPNKKNFNIDSYGDIILYIWIVGMLILFLLKIVPYVIFKNAILKHSLEVKDKDILGLFNLCKDELNINSKIAVRICRTIGSPMLIGIFHPTVLIPNINEDEKALKIIFLHELNHYKRKDIITKTLGFIVNIIHWFNPIVYILLKKIDIYCEYSIDEKLVDKMGIEDRKHYGETILKLIDNSIVRRISLTTAMGTSGKELKHRLENMLFSFKTTRTRYITSLFVLVLILISGLAIACSIMPHKVIGGNASFIVYIKEDGLYFSYLNNEKETKIQEGKGKGKGKEFSYPVISKSGNYIAYTNKESLYIYDIKNKKYEKIGEKSNYFDNYYDWIDDETIIYSSNEPGFTIYNVSTKEKREHLDKYHYENFKASNGNIIYGKKISKWTGPEGEFASIMAIVEINLNKYSPEDKKYEIKTIIKGKEPTDAMLGYNPTISKITDDGRYVFIMEKFASGSTSADFAGIGLYDTKEKRHIDFTDIYEAEGGTYGTEDKDLIVLPDVNNLAINPRNNNLVGVIKGGFRERFMNKKLVLLNINEDKTYEAISFMDKKYVAMTPSFTLDGERLLYSATESVDPDTIRDFNQAYKDWEGQPHNIYEFDLKTSKVKKTTAGDSFDFMPLSISQDELLFCRYKGNGYCSFIKLVNGKEEMLADNIINNYLAVDEGTDIFLSEKN